MNTTLCDNVEWVGYVDWHIRDFHGYSTNRGSTYNSYLVRDRKTALIDTVKAPYVPRLLANIQQHTDLGKVDYLVCNHAEPDHASGLSAVVKACPSAKVVCTEKCRKALAGYHDISAWDFEIVKSGDTLSLGERSLVFLETPMVHWPESMMTYLPEEKLLFSQDAFGQHYASAGRFDDEEPCDVVMYEAKVYYANIIMWAGKPIAKALEAASAMEIGMIAPAHGIIWRKCPERIIEAYQGWIVCKAQPKVLVAYDTMWHSTERMAEAILDGASKPGVHARLYSVRKNHITLLATEVLDAAAIAFGSPTLNGTLMPEVAAGLTYLKGLRPTCKSGFAFGSYGWAPGGAKAVNEYLQEMKFELLREPLEAQWTPTPDILEECRKAGELLAEKALESACAV